jgi:CBS domain-containing protein
MRIKDCMTREVRIVDPAETVRDAARTMIEIDAGFLPVAQDDRLIGIVTDRDLAVRALAAGRDARTTIRDVMSAEVRYCFEDDDVDAILTNMADLQVRRLPVVDRAKRLVGVVSISDLAHTGNAAEAGAALDRIARPSGLHSQTA